SRRTGNGYRGAVLGTIPPSQALPARALEPRRERGGYYGGGWAPFAAANQAWFDHSASAVQHLLKFVAAKGVRRVNSVFRAERGFPATALMEHHNFRRLGARGADLS